MALRINHNIAALDALRHLNETDEALSKSLEVLSSGQKINRAADGPAALVISEQMRGQIASINQAIQNSEASISMVQTAEAALNEVAHLLVSMRQLTIHAANEGANDDRMIEADQNEINNALDTIDRIARTSQFGTRTLLDGSNGASGVAVGKGLHFVSASPETKSSPAQGYAVDITRAATRAEKKGSRPIELSDLNAGPDEPVKPFRITISEGGKTISFDLENRADGGTIRKFLAEYNRNPNLRDPKRLIRDIRKTIAESLKRKAVTNGLNVDVRLVPGPGGEVLDVRDKTFGSKPTFFVGSTAAGVLAAVPGRFEEAVPGHDVEGTIDGKIAVGEGQLLKGAQSTNVQGLTVRFDSERTIVQRIPKFVPDGGGVKPNPNIPRPGAEVPPNGVKGATLVSRSEDANNVVFTWEAPADVSKSPDGYAHVTQNSLSFQVGPTRGQQVKISLIDAKANRLARGVANASGFQSLKEINVTTPQGAQDSLLLIDKAISQISKLRADLGAFQKNTLQSNANSLRVAQENLTSAESSLRDADMAAEVSKFTRNQIMLSSGIAMLAQANQTPKTVLQLLTNNAG